MAGSDSIAVAEVILPSATEAWYDEDSITKLERDSLPEWF